MSRSGPAFETSTRAPKDWRDEAECGRLDAYGNQVYEPNLWWPLGRTAVYTAQIIEAKTICGMCPVRIECDDFAETPGAVIREGIWAGLTEDERDKRRRRKARERQALKKQGY